MVDEFVDSQTDCCTACRVLCDIGSAGAGAVGPAWAATVAEFALGVLLIAGWWPRWTALGSALLLGMFGTAKAVSMGIKSPLDYAVFSASAAACLPAFQFPAI
jgi:hypothetical protein